MGAAAVIKTGIYILYIFTHVNSGTVINAHDFDSHAACIEASRIIAKSGAPDIEKMVCVPKK